MSGVATDAARGVPLSRGVISRMVLPFVVLALSIFVWHLVVSINNIPPYVLPGPALVAETLIQDWPILWSSLLTTLLTTFEGFIAAAVGGIALALLFSQSKWQIGRAHV